MEDNFFVCRTGTLAQCRRILGLYLALVLLEGCVYERRDLYVLGGFSCEDQNLEISLALEEDRTRSGQAPRIKVSIQNRGRHAFRVAPVFGWNGADVFLWIENIKTGKRIDYGYDSVRGSGSSSFRELGVDGVPYICLRPGDESSVTIDLAFPRVVFGQKVAVNSPVGVELPPGSYRVRAIYEGTFPKKTVFCPGPPCFIESEWLYFEF